MNIEEINKILEETPDKAEWSSTTSLKFKKDLVICPNSLVVSYALAIAASGNASNIVLAGFNGYDLDDSRHLDMELTFSILNSKSKIQISSITPTKYKIKANFLHV